MPIRRVIIRDLYLGQAGPANIISSVRYRQMAGRAGRQGLESLGEVTCTAARLEATLDQPIASARLLIRCHSALVSRVDRSSC